MNVTGASLTVALEEPGSAINQFFDQVLPLDGPLRERWASELRRLRAQRGSAVSAVTSHLDGMAIELRIASDLAPPPKISLLGAAGTTLGTIFLEHLASVPEEHPSLEKIVRLGFDFGDRSDDEVLRFCRRLGTSSISTGSCASISHVRPGSRSQPGGSSSWTAVFRKRIWTACEMSGVDTSDMAARSWRPLANGCSYRQSSPEGSA
jgi:hypothetical protein